MALTQAERDELLGLEDRFEHHRRNPMSADEIRRLRVLRGRDEAVREVVCTAKLTVLVGGEFMTDEELRSVVESTPVRLAMCRALADALEGASLARAENVGWTADERPVYLKEIAAADVRLLEH